MDAAVQMAPTFRFYKDGNKINEYVGSSYPALEVRAVSSARAASVRCAHRPALTEQGFSGPDSA